MFWFLVLWGCLYYFQPHPRPTLGIYCHKATGISLDKRGQGSTPTSVSASTALSSNSVMVFLTPSCTRIPKFCTWGSASSTGRRVMRKVWVTCRVKKCRWAACPQQPPEEKADALCIPFHTIPGVTDWPGTQRWILFGKIEFLCLCPGLRAEGNGALSTMVAPGPPVKGEDAELIPIKEGSEFLTHLVDSIRERKAEGIWMLLSLTGVDILNVSWSEVSLRKGTNLDA